MGIANVNNKIRCDNVVPVRLLAVVAVKQQDDVLREHTLMSRKRTSSCVMVLAQRIISSALVLICTADDALPHGHLRL